MKLSIIKQYFSIQLALLAVTFIAFRVAAVTGILWLCLPGLAAALVFVWITYKQVKEQESITDRQWQEADSAALVALQKSVDAVLAIAPDSPCLTCAFLLMGSPNICNAFHDPYGVESCADWRSKWEKGGDRA